MGIIEMMRLMAASACTRGELRKHATKAFNKAIMMGLCNGGGGTGRKRGNEIVLQKYREE